MTICAVQRSAPPPQLRPVFVDQTLLEMASAIPSMKYNDTSSDKSDWTSNDWNAIFYDNGAVIPVEILKKHPIADLMLVLNSWQQMLGSDSEELPNY